MMLTSPAKGQFRAFASVDRVNGELAGHVDDYTNNHGPSRRIYSHVLCRHKGYVCLCPPCYNPNRAYPILLYFHVSRIDERDFIGSGRLRELDQMIVRTIPADNRDLPRWDNYRPKSPSWAALILCQRRERAIRGSYSDRSHSVCDEPIQRPAGAGCLVQFRSVGGPRGAVNRDQASRLFWQRRDLGRASESAI